VPKRWARRASSFAIFGLRVGFVRIANVLDLVRWLVMKVALNKIVNISKVAIYQNIFAI